MKISKSGSVVAAIAMVLALALPGRDGLAAGASPRAVVEGFHYTLISVMQEADQLKFQGRYQKLEPEVNAAFHLPLMARVAIGSAWRSATDQQKMALIAAFARMSVSTYASRFDGFSGESFQTNGERAGPQNTVLVQTQINRPNDDPVALTYVTKQFSDGWRIVDVLLAGGISELAVRRSEYKNILQVSGVNGLVTALNRSSANLSTGG